MSIKIRCPYCGSDDCTTIMWGLPDLVNIMKRGEKGEKLVIGGCCISDNDPTYKCQACRKSFGKPPFVKTRKSTVKNGHLLMPDIINKIEFSIGSFFHGYNFVKIVRKGNVRAICVHHSMDLTPFYIREFTADEWNRLMSKLFYRLFVHEWKRKYTNEHVKDGIQWSLEFTMEPEVKYLISGSNDYPPNFDSLNRIFDYYINQKVPLEEAVETAGQWIDLFLDDFAVETHYIDAKHTVHPPKTVVTREEWEKMKSELKE